MNVAPVTIFLIAVAVTGSTPNSGLRYDRRRSKPGSLTEAGGCGTSVPQIRLMTQQPPIQPCSSAQCRYPPRKRLQSTACWYSYSSAIIRVRTHSSISDSQVMVARAETQWHSSESDGGWSALRCSPHFHAYRNSQRRLSPPPIKWLARSGPDARSWL